MKDATQYNASTYERLWNYAHYQPPETTPWWPLVRELAAGSADRLEIGPGPWPKFPVRGTQVVDLSPHSLAMLESRGAIIHRGLLADLHLGEASFDLVGLFQVLEHVPDDDALLGELARIVRPGGRIIVGVPMQMAKWTPFDTFAGHVRRYEPSELKGRLARRGFTIERFEARPEAAGRFQAVAFMMLCRFFPRLAMMLSERVLLPGMQKLALEWLPPSRWDEATRDAGQCTVIIRRE